MSKYDSMLGKQFGDYIMDRCVGIDGTGHKLYAFKCHICGDEFITTPYEVISGRHKTICQNQHNTKQFISNNIAPCIDEDNNTCDCDVEFTHQINDNLTISEIKGDLFDVNFNYYIAHVVPFSLHLRGSSIARRIDECYDMEVRLKLAVEEMDYEVGDVLEVANVYNMILGYRDAQKHYHRPSLNDIRESVRVVAESCRIDHVPFLAMPRICTGALGYDWNEIKEIIIEVFSDVYNNDVDNTYHDGFDVTPLSVEIYHL